MKDLITQRINYAEIRPYRDYCRLDEKKDDNHGIFNNSLDYLDDATFGSSTESAIKFGDYRSSEDKKKKVGRIVELPPKRGNRKVNFFNNPKGEIAERFEIMYAGKGLYYTTNNRHIVNHYGNPFSDIRIKTFERSVRLHGDKVTIKIYQQIKNREFNQIYFHKAFYVYSVTFNLKTGNFTTLIMQKTSKMNRKVFRTNCFFSLKSVLSLDNGIISNHNAYDDMLDLNTKSKILDIMDNNVFCDKINEVLKLDSKNPHKWNKKDGDLFDKLMEKFVKLKKIKVPNNYQTLLSTTYPTEKFLKKNDRKLIASALDLFKIKSKITIKIMHLDSNIRVDYLAELCYLFGKDFSKYIASVNVNLFINNSTKLKTPAGKIVPSPQFDYGIFELFDCEKETLIKLLNSNSGDDDIYGTMDLLYDHFKMIKKIREYIPETILKSKNWIEFRVEHNEFSKVISTIKKGWSIEYIFNQKMIKDVENKIVTNFFDNKMEHLPYILKREEEYIEEGLFMHHCVASYADKKKSIIISLRSDDGLDRVTSEYDTQSGYCLQSRYFCNAKPPEEYNEALVILGERVETFARLGLLNSIEVKKVPVKINGVEVSQLPIHSAIGDNVLVNNRLFEQLPF